MGAWECCHSGLRRALMGPSPAPCASSSAAARGGPGPPPDPPPVPEPPPAGLDAGEPEVLSRRQQKKQILRDIRQGRKGQKKVQKQADALGVALAALEVAVGALLPDGGDARDAGVPHGTGNAPAAGATDGPAESAPGAWPRQRPPPSSPPDAPLAARLRGAFGVDCSYRELPVAHGPSPSQGLAALGAALVRPHKYSEKFLPQEYSLLHKVWCLLEGDDREAGILDIGAGNANCATLAAALLGLTVICVERESPREELRAEMQLPPRLRHRVVRVESDIADFGPDALRSLASTHGLRRVVMVAKHPCGICVDRTIEFAGRLRSVPPDGQTPAIVGLVMATCCTNKLSLDDNRVSRVGEFCSLYSAAVPGGGGPALERAVEVLSRCSAWRSASGSEGNAIHGDQVAWAELFEDSVQALRLGRLAEIFEAVEQVRFAPAECTLQDRCLVAGPAPLPEGVLAHGEAVRDGGFLRRLRAGVAELLADGGPMDCRPKGLRSAKYDFDYTGISE